MADDKKVPHSLQDQTADQIRNEQRGGDGSPVDPDEESGPEANATMRRVWDQPGGEAYSYRSALPGAGGKADEHGELTAAETPEATKHLSDASLSPDEGDATAEAIARAASAGRDKAHEGRDEKPAGHLPPAGPHADPTRVEPDATRGEDDETDSATG